MGTEFSREVCHNQPPTRRSSGTSKGLRSAPPAPAALHWSHLLVAGMSHFDPAGCPPAFQEHLWEIRKRRAFGQTPSGATFVRKASCEISLNAFVVSEHPTKKRKWCVGRVPFVKNESCANLSNLIDWHEWQDPFL